jgi:hypothetical protein
MASSSGASGNGAPSRLATAVRTKNPSAIVSKVWNYAHVLKNAGVGPSREASIFLGPRRMPPS